MTQDPTRERLIEAASRLFGREGFRRVTVRDICRAAHANVAAVNYYFGDKMGLYMEVVDRAIAVMQGTTTAAQEGSGGLSPQEKLRHYVRTYLSALLQSPDANTWIHGIMNQEMNEPTKAAAKIAREAIRPRVEYLSGIIAGVLGADVSDPRVRRCAIAVQSHCLWYGRQPQTSVFRKAAFPEWPDEITTGLEGLAAFVAEFSLAGVAGVH
ncbi:MAG TPA: CerR family C-terminal domain-containing protein [Gemmatimonadales bacterium]|nr:CerR family C-terminal domain-containing protein [Gemmatimonadales bacterium]